MGYICKQTQKLLVTMVASKDRIMEAGEQEFKGEMIFIVDLFVPSKICVVCL